MAFTANHAPTHFHSAEGGTLFTRLVEGFRAWRDYRSALGALQSLSDRDLSDIGLERGDLGRIARAGK